MKIKRKDRSVPGLNMTATADISFMLLIFFLVTTSMYVDKGLSRQLPPKDKDKDQKELTIDKENIMALRLDSIGQLFVNDSLVNIKEAKDCLEEFILKKGKDHLITLKSSPDCHYEYYFHLQDALVQAYGEAREQVAQKKYGRPLSQLTSVDREHVLEECPQRVAEDYSGGETNQTREEGAI